MEILVIIGLILLLLVLWIISVQRKFAVMDGNIQNAMNQIGVQISSRFDALFAVLDKNYTKCMDAVECYGRMVYTSRLIYNDSVTKLNSALGMFPTNVIAGILGFHKREYLSQKGD